MATVTASVDENVKKEELIKQIEENIEKIEG